MSNPPFKNLTHEHCDLAGCKALALAQVQHEVLNSVAKVLQWLPKTTKTASGA